jgi:TolB-like protein/class 3 adenylate cyclase/predicted Ser/Thr protein kinase
VIGSMLDHFRILEQLGAGGMGVVYRARDERLDRDVALKLLPADALSDGPSRDRLLREARVASGLNHPNICTIYAVAEAGGKAYIAMEYVEGRTLSALLSGGGLPVSQVVQYGLQLADALSHAHEHGVVHRDLKSANVMVTPQGRAKVLDFGLAKRQRSADDGAVRSQLSLTGSGVVMGTPAYMAPEQLLGDAADARSDIWALGVVLYEMVTGVQPFHGQSAFDLTVAIMHHAPPPLPPLAPAGLHALIGRCMAKEPAQRYQRASEVREALEAVQADIAVLPTEGEQRRLAAILYGDSSGPAASAQTGESRAREFPEERGRLLRPILPKHGGREMQATGNAFLVEFSSAVDAARCGIEIQTAVAGRNAAAAPEDRMDVRIGLHVGEVIHRENEVAGDGVSIAAALEPLAAPAGICLSDDLARQVRGRIDLPIRRIGQHTLANAAAPMDVYRVVLPWEKSGSLSAAALASLSDWRYAPPRRKWLAAAGGMVVLGALAAALNIGGVRQRLGAQRAAPAIRALLVLPLTNLSGDPAQEFMADGMTDELISELTKIGGLTVVSRTTAMQYKGAHKPLAEMVKEQGVDGVVEGGVGREGATIHVNVQLIDARTGKNIWGDSYDRGSGGIMALRGEVVRAIAGEVKVKLSPLEEQALRAAARPVNPEAYEAYLKGRMFWYRQTPQDVDRALAYFQFATEKDPTFPLAFLGVGYVWTYYASAGLQPPSESRRQLIQANQKALELDSTLAEAHEGLADLKFYYDWDWATAEREYRRAIDLKPNSADMRLYYWEFLAAMKRPAEAEVQVRRCLELDPLNSYVQMIYGMFLLSARRYDEAIAQFEKLLRTDADFGPARLGLWMAYHHTGKEREALATAKEFFTKWDDVEMAKALTTGQARGGYRGAMRLAADKLSAQSKNTFVLAIQVAQLYAYAGDKEQAMDWLEKAFQQRETGLVKMQIDPDWDTLRQEPRFKHLVARMNFPAA